MGLGATNKAMAGHKVNPKPPRSIPNQANFFLCSIDDCFAHSGNYLVTLPLGGTIYATDLFHMGGTPSGARPIGMYPPKTKVVVMFNPLWECGIILGAMSGGVNDATSAIPDSLVLRSNVGLFQDPYHYNPYTKSDFNVALHSAGRPVDMLPGDWGGINDLGMAVYLGRLMAGLRASDSAKVEAFWGDDLLRIVGYNYELFTSGSQESRLNDENEYNDVARITPFPWEALGVTHYGTNPFRTQTGQLAPSSNDAPIEPTQNDQLIIPRHIIVRGYLGGIEQEMVCVPPKSLQTERYANKTIYTGVLEIQKNMDGAYAVRSAKEITLEKYILLPVPKELIAAEDPLGDHSPTYKPSGIGDSAVKLPEFIWGADDPQVRAAQMFDYHAWFFGRYTKAQYDAHKLDWYLPDESGLQDLSGRAMYNGGQLRIGHAFTAPMPDFGTLVIDQRSGHSVNYYRSRSAIKLHDDGGVTIEDGYGSQLRMAGGNIFLSCVGDVITQPGRSAITMAPFDVCLRAGNSLDATAALGDLRLKADKNIQVLAANSGQGGMLFESRSTGQSTATGYQGNIGQKVTDNGITFKASKSSFNVFAQDLYIGCGQTTSGTLTVDAGDNGTLYLRGSRLMSRLAQEFIIMFEDKNDSSVHETLAMDKQATTISTRVAIGGDMVITDHIGGGNLIVSGAVIGHKQAAFELGVASNSGFASPGGGLVAPMDKPLDLSPKPPELKSQLEDDLTKYAQIIDPIEKKVTDNSDTSPGNDDFQKAVGVSLRDTKDDLKLDSSTFLIYEARWQQMLRTGGGSGTPWNEPYVVAPNDGGNTLPYPGKDGWESFQSYVTVDNNVDYDMSGGKAKARAAMSEKGEKVSKKAMKSGYVINIQT